MSIASVSPLSNGAEKKNEKPLDLAFQGGTGTVSSLSFEDSILGLEVPDLSPTASTQGRAIPYTLSNPPTAPLPPLPASETHLGGQPTFDTHEGYAPWILGDKLHYEIPKKHDQWQHFHELSQNCDKALCEAWKDEVDKLLVFAGLFSAAVTAFVVESYKWLQEDYTQESLNILMEIIVDLKSSGDSRNSSESVRSLSGPSSSFIASPVNLRINTLWFLSLTLSLSTVVTGILCMQWLREYQKYTGSYPDQQTFAVRQMRFDGIMKWRVPSIVSALPILLQTALVLFFVGLVDFLWCLHLVVAIPVIICIGIVVLFILFTTVAPAVQACVPSSFFELQFRVMTQCPYKSPQSWLVLKIFSLVSWKGVEIWLITLDYVRFICKKMRINVSHFYTLKGRLLSFITQRRRVTSLTTWSSYDDYWRSFREDIPSLSWTPSTNPRGDVDLSKALHWVHTMFSQRDDVVFSLHHALRALHPQEAQAIILTIYNEQDECQEECKTITESSLTDSQKSAMLSTVYLNSSILHRSTSLVRNHVAESYIRYINMADDPQMLRPVVCMLSSEDGTPDMAIQFLLAHKYAIDRDILQPHQIEQVFLFIRSHAQLYMHGWDNVPWQQADRVTRRDILRLISSTIKSSALWLGRVVPPSKTILKELQHEQKYFNLIHWYTNGLLDNIRFPELKQLEQAEGIYAQSFSHRITSSLAFLAEVIDSRRCFLGKKARNTEAHWADFKKCVMISMVELMKYERLGAGVISSLPLSK